LTESSDTNIDLAGLGHNRAASWHAITRRR
jgi:hypothetical protein